MDFFTDAAPKQFWNYLKIRSGSGQHPGLFRCFTHGIRNWIIMCICTVLFQAAGLQKMEKSENLPKTFLSAQKYCGISSRVNIWHTFPLFMKAAPLPFPLPVKGCVILTTGKNLKISFMKWIGVLTLRKPLTALAMPLNTSGGILTKSPFPTAGFFLLREMW